MVCSMVRTSARACNGCEWSDSMLTTGTVDTAAMRSTTWREKTRAASTAW